MLGIVTCVLKWQKYFISNCLVLKLCTLFASVGKKNSLNSAVSALYYNMLCWTTFCVAIFIYFFLIDLLSLSYTPYTTFQWETQYWICTYFQGHLKWFSPWFSPQHLAMSTWEGDEVCVYAQMTLHPYSRLFKKVSLTFSFSPHFLMFRVKTRNTRPHTVHNIDTIHRIGAHITNVDFT